MIALNSRVLVDGKFGRVTHIMRNGFSKLYCVRYEDGLDTVEWFAEHALTEVGEPLPRRVPPKEPVVCASPLAIKATYQWNMQSKARGRI